jgi:hypothetical protein
VYTRSNVIVATDRGFVDGTNCTTGLNATDTAVHSRGGVEAIGATFSKTFVGSCGAFINS